MAGLNHTHLLKAKGRLVAGSIPYRYKSSSNGVVSTDELEVLLITSNKGLEKEMMFPKRRWELGEPVEETALRHSIVKAGVSGRLQAMRLSLDKSNLPEVFMFPLLVTEQLEFWPHKNARAREWMSLSEAREACSHSWMIEALDMLVERLSLTSRYHHDAGSLALEPLMPNNSAALNHIAISNKINIGAKWVFEARVNRAMVQGLI